MDTNLKETVFLALDIALENGYDFSSTNADEVSADLQRYDSDAEKYGLEEIKEMVVKWQEGKRRAPMARRNS